MTAYLIIDKAPLDIAVEVKTAVQQVHRLLEICRPVLLEAVVVVVMALGIDIGHRLNPFQCAEMVAIVKGIVHSRLNQAAPGLVFDIHIAGIEVIVHLFHTHQIALGVGVIAVLLELGALFELLVPAAALGIVKGGAAVQILCQLHRVDSLNYMLHIIVGLVVVVGQIAIGAGVLAGRVVAAVGLHLLFADAVPGDAGALPAVDIYQLCTAAPAIPAAHHVRGVQTGKGVADVSLGAVVVITHIQAEAVLTQASAGPDASHRCKERAAGNIQFQIGPGMRSGRNQVKAAAKGAHAVGR